MSAALLLFLPSLHARLRVLESRAALTEPLTLLQCCRPCRPVSVDPSLYWSSPWPTFNLYYAGVAYYSVAGVKTPVCQVTLIGWEYAIGACEFPKHRGPQSALQQGWRSRLAANAGEATLPCSTGSTPPLNDPPPTPHPPPPPRRQLLLQQRLHCAH